MQEKSSSQPLIRIVDDDSSVRVALLDLFQSIDLEAIAYDSPRALLEADNLDTPGCIVLDVRFSGSSGLDFQSDLQKAGNRMPIIVVTGHGDIPMSVRAMKAGAIDFLTKPFRDQDLIDAVTGAIKRDQVIRSQSQTRSDVERLRETLTPREVEVMHAVVNGYMNKQIAGQLGISMVTVKLHRSNVMKKMRVRSVADLVKKAELLGQDQPAAQGDS
ncbi:response regulator transcription factor [Neorhizobium alkalisoli]|uniref:LuxR family two component transcriptional regulator n=1 Tax=Neorhizobium alkalisoli TaxID=528178 RepID=A0A561QCA1_9HYPH|nr:response regulator [Neorhizobium alkalisoli]TWF47962.1 LuxR family two component transcriptional regulator [Neorhizobium alkalisoli]